MSASAVLRTENGNNKRRESVKAQNGTMYGADADGCAVYSVQLSVEYEKSY